MYTRVNCKRRGQSERLKEGRDWLCLSGEDQVSDKLAGKGPGLTRLEEETPTPQIPILEVLIGTQEPTLLASIPGDKEAGHP